MSLAEIAALKLIQVWAAILLRLVDFSGVPDGEIPYHLLEDENLSTYERIVVHQSIEKPSEEVMLQELEVYKQELKEAEEARLAEVARIEGLKRRWKAIPDIRGAFFKAGIEVKNPALELKRIIKENDQARMTQLESAWESFKTENETKEKTKKDRKKRLKEYNCNSLKEEFLKDLCFEMKQ